VINLDGSPDGGLGSPARRGEPTFTDMAAHIPSSSAGQSSRGPGPAIRLDHLSIIYPGVQSNWHVERKAKDLTGVYPYDVELMSKVGEVGCFEAGSVMLVRCLALMQHHRRVAEVRVVLRRRLGDLKQKIEDLTKSKAELKREVETLNQTITSRDAMLVDKEARVAHFQGLCERREAELSRAGEVVAATEAQVAEVRDEMAKKESAWEAEKFDLEQACVAVYKDDFFKVMKQALLLAPDIDPSGFDIDRDDEQPGGDSAS